MGGCGGWEQRGGAPPLALKLASAAAAWTAGCLSLYCWWALAACLPQQARCSQPALQLLNNSELGAAAACVGCLLLIARQDGLAGQNLDCGLLLRKERRELRAASGGVCPTSRQTHIVMVAQQMRQATGHAPTAAVAAAGTAATVPQQQRRQHHHHHHGKQAHLGRLKGQAVGGQGLIAGRHACEKQRQDRERSVGA